MEEIAILVTVGSDWKAETSNWESVLQKSDPPLGQIIFTSLRELANSTDGRRERIACKFEMPNILFNTVCMMSGGFSGCEPIFNDQDELESYNHWSRFIVKHIHRTLKPKRSFTEHSSTLKGRSLINEHIPNPIPPVHSKKTASHGWEWHEMGIFLHWKADHSTMLCFDFPEQLQMSTQSALAFNTNKIDFTDPYSIFSIILSEMMALYDDSVWSIRNHVSGLEVNRLREPDYPLMHEIARHAVHVSETLTVALSSLKALQEHRNAFITQHCRNSSRRSRVRNNVDFQIQLLRSLLSRSGSNIARIQNEITLVSLEPLSMGQRILDYAAIFQIAIVHGITYGSCLLMSSAKRIYTPCSIIIRTSGLVFIEAFHTAAQRDSKIQVQIGQEAKKETIAMKVIALVTMTFLPATFVSSVFSMSFFYFEPGKDGMKEAFEVSNMFWMYWAFAIPLSLVGLGVWRFWDRSWSRKYHD